MRMRKKPNLIPRMERCAHLLIAEPEKLRSRWHESFPGFSEIRLELGCGKGRFTVEQAASEPETLLLALEKVPDAMVVAMERAAERDLKNVRFMDRDAGLLGEIFAPGEVSRLYINFCDPWPKSRDAKLRLTAPGFLRQYADLLAPGGEIHFKTDNAALFEWSLAGFAEEGWETRNVTRDLHAGGPSGVMTDYEAKFYDRGVKICRLEAVRLETTKSTAAGPVPRLRNASLTDARGYAESAEAASEGSAT
ncbi:MAG: tRNA (guanosine(46)-N7)-methyltransferase TrmB [Oscillospiraceae bacterium]|nr:tRNA (guanosine(46)-N7)-methyltransferase TrmB [Oscillospiraceae bacterium]